MNRAGEKDTLITYERALEAQADLRKFRGSTIERKQMSTKTTFKRVALVAVAALGLGVFTSVPSNAAPAITYGVIADSANGQGIIGGQATVVIALDTNTVTNIKVTGVGSVIGVSTQESTTVLGTPTSGSWTDSTTVIGAIASVNQTVTLTSAVAGVTTITATPISSTTGAPGTAGGAATKSFICLSPDTGSITNIVCTSGNAAAQGGPAGSTVAVAGGVAETIATTANMIFLNSTRSPMVIFSSTQTMELSIWRHQLILYTTAFSGLFHAVALLYLIHC
jgi:hypothetical protein